VAVRRYKILGAFTITNKSKPYPPSELVRVFDAAWTAIHPTGRRLKFRQEDRRRLDLAKCIIALAEDGVTDPRELRRRAIEEMLLSES
jgi:hypothetical protein